MRNLNHFSIALMLVMAWGIVRAQEEAVLASAKSVAISPDPKVRAEQNVVVITGNRFSYPLVQKWIDDYTTANPNVQIIIESRGTSDPAKYDILVEAYEQPQEVKETREYIYVARYAIVPVANDKSHFAKQFTAKGLDADLIKQIFFHDIFVDQEKVRPIRAPFNVYTRLQKAGAPIVFSRYFKHEQQDIKGIAIAGADDHLLKALLRDSVGVSYLPLSLAYDQNTRKPIEGLAILPVDLNGNGKVSDEERIFDDLDQVIKNLETTESADHRNIPVGSLHLSVDKTNASPEAVEFLKWVNANGQRFLHPLGYLVRETKHDENDQFDQFASRRGRQ
jgi:phosphate transport system substrate-binding protein